MDLDQRNQSDPGSPESRCWTPALGVKVAALFVESGGCYFNLPGVDPWDIERDARKYNGPHPVVAHPPCQRWGRYWHGSPNAPHQYRKGEDHGCFAVALTAVRNYGGVLEHPAHSHAWAWFGLAEPPAIGWGRADNFGGMTCQVEQGHYGHLSRKGTWLYSVGCGTPDLRWGPSEQKINPVALAKHGYEKARRIGMMAMIGGKDKTIIRNATPPAFRDVLLSLASNHQASGRSSAAPVVGCEQSNGENNHV
jgi:hypothetical protein